MEQKYDKSSRTNSVGYSRLTDVEKLHLVDVILRDLDRPDPEIDRIWADEARKRWDAYKLGKMQSISYQDVMSRYKR